MSAGPHRESPWEHGSFLPAPHERTLGGGVDLTEPRWRFYATARGALAALVRFGARTRAWDRILVPGYFCHDALRPLQRDGHVLVSYEDVPGVDAEVRAVPGDVVLLNNLLGLRASPRPVPPAVDVIEDHTHDPFSPWALTSTATYCVASLRKTMPVPDGAVVWSPVGAPLPDVPGVAGPGQAVAEVYAAMALKRTYLDKGWDVKDVYRRLFNEGTEVLEGCGAAPGSSLTAALVRDLPVVDARDRRGCNHGLLAEHLDVLDGVDVLHPGPGAVPVGCTIRVEAERRDAFRGRLLDRDVYPAVLWPLAEPVVAVTPTERQLSDEVLTFQCDARYTASHLEELARRVRGSLAW